MTETRELVRAPAAPRARRRLRRWLLCGSAVALVVLVGWLVAFSPVLGASRITVRGTRTISAEEVRDAARVAHGTPLVRLDTAAVSHRVEQLPAVARAAVTVSYPNTVLITVTERVAVGYITADGSTVLVDRTGRQFRTVPAPPAGLPRFDVPAGAAAQAAGEAVATVAGALPPAVLPQLAVIRAVNRSSVTLTLRDGRTVLWGSADGSAEKARILPTLLQQPGTFYNVSDPEQVYTH